MASTQPRGITRNRERLACEACRRRKLRCNRALPCDACVRRDDGERCSYQRLAGGPEAERRSRMESRLEHLEQLVHSLLSPGAESRTNGDEAAVPISMPMPETVSSTPGMKGIVEGGMITSQLKSPSYSARSTRSQEQSFHGATHWSTVLDDIHELRLLMSTDDAEEVTEEAPVLEVSLTDSTDGGLGIPLGSFTAAHVSLKDVFTSYLPPRQEVDRLTSAYHRAQSLAAPFIHAKHFQRLYQLFWADPLGTSPLWTSILFSICHISSNALQHGSWRPGMRLEDKDNRFSTAAALCLALGQYHRPQRFAVESLLLYIQSQCLTNNVLPPDLGPLLGVLIRVATRMGYHQDTSPPRFSPFEEEMRRRTWSLCMQLDLLVSFHLGLPSAVHFSAWASRLPTSLNDCDFDEDTTELPPAKSDSEATGIMFVTAKHKFMVVFDKILRHALTGEHSHTKDTSEVDALDAEMQQVFTSLPLSLRPRPMADSVFDPPGVTVTRLCLLFLYCKCLCVLHRPYVVLLLRDDVSSGRSESCLRACHAAASRLVQGFADGSAEFVPGGQIETEGWFMSSLTWHDFLLGAVSLCLAALAGLRGRVLSGGELQASAVLLARAWDICAKQAMARGTETGRVGVLIASTLRRLSATATEVPGHTVTSGVPNGHFEDDGTYATDESNTAAANDSLWDEYLQQFLDMDEDDPTLA